MISNISFSYYTSKTKKNSNMIIIPYNTLHTWLTYTHYVYSYTKINTCVCVCARARARVRKCVRACAWVCLCMNKRIIYVGDSRPAYASI